MARHDIKVLPWPYQHIFERKKRAIPFLVASLESHSVPQQVANSHRLSLLTTMLILTKENAKANTAWFQSFTHILLPTLNSGSMSLINRPALDHPCHPVYSRRRFKSAVEYGLIKPQCTGKSGYRTAAVQRGDMEKVTSILHGDTAGQDRIFVASMQQHL